MQRFVFVMLCSPALAAAQSHPLVGQWNISVPSMVRGADGQPTPITAKGLMTVTMVGDSLIAIVKMGPVPGQPASKEQRVAGPRTAVPVRLSSTSNASLVGGSQELSRRAGISYVLDVKGDVLVGALQLSVEGVPDIPERPLQGTRANNDQ